MGLRAIEWRGDALFLLDQRLLPEEEVWLECRSWREVERAIRDMAIRGAPAIGAAAAFGVLLGAIRGEDLDEVFAGLAAARPTAVNLCWALERMARIEASDTARLQAEALAILDQDLAANLEIGRLGAELLPRGARILTICNTGALATAGHGTALGVVRSAWARDPSIEVFVCETRPRLQGLKLTAFELLHEGIPFRAIVDGAAAWLMRSRGIDAVIVGADRIARNGDVANKIGTYSLAVNARSHGVQFLVAAPWSSVDLRCQTGEDILIEERDAREITELGGARIAPTGTEVWNPAFDVTPSDLVSAIITERGVFRAPFEWGGA